MNCNDVQDQLSGLRDGELESSTALLVEAHLEECELCRTQHQRLAELDAGLTRALTTERIAAAKLAERALQQLSDTGRASRSGPLWPRLVSYAAVAAAGFLLAWSGFPSGQQPPPGQLPIVQTVPARVLQKQTSETDASARSTASPPVARLVHGIGVLSYRSPAGSEWQSIDQATLPVFSCPSESVIKTDPGVLCELETASGSRIRLNESSEVAFRSDQELELKQGQIWCRAADDCELRVITHEGPPAAVSPEQWTLACSTSTELVTTSAPNQPLQVVSTAGSVDVHQNGTGQSLPPGRLCTLTEEGVTVRESAGELIDAERWMQPLLTLGGHGNPDLVRRVDTLLARIGRTKLATLYEQDLRNLGEYGALPLMKFVQSETSPSEADRRRIAMNILADTAPIWMVPDLIALLKDEDAAIRASAARGLTRLTGETQGRPPQAWNEDRSGDAEVIAAWEQWWLRHRFACPAPPPNSGAGAFPGGKPADSLQSPPLRF